MHKRQQERYVFIIGRSQAQAQPRRIMTDIYSRAKIDEIYSGKKKSSNGGGGKPTAGAGANGTAKATLDVNGKLIWD